MNNRMQGKPSKTARKKRAEVPMSAAMQAAMFKVANVAANLSRKDEAAQQAARKAIADTIEEWIAFLTENEPEAVDQFYYEVCMMASAGNRRRISKHALMPAGIVEQVEDDLKKQKEEAERAAAKERAVEKAKEDGEQVPA
ncbi:MAG TPA: hypothetical protein DC031_05370 [Sulfitobacter sp.]|jgi:hypothetical protein|uniref:hypothetical protein n=1 Tax=Sulfitobacter dubius TaxID=218673 RepID=UPI000C5D527F|nr:hypothetical protein [Sulfitobacter sp.]HBB82699.1 hypothetical protein [Sulfitobacter sp.]|tara:strand:+ start:660 stop:1082 length:423 start_codon:yes stop_codon:yes gene_type:complete